MKQIIILCATILLGLTIFSMVAGPGDTSVMSTVKGVWEQEIAVRKMYP